MKKIFRIVEKKNLWFSISLTIIALGFGIMIPKALNSKPLLNYGIDFAGGSTMNLKFEALENIQKEKGSKAEGNKLFIEKVRNILKNFGLEKSVIQITDNNEIQIKTHALKNKKHDEILTVFSNELGKYEILEIDYIGPSVGHELRNSSIWIVLLVSVLLMIYITFRFELQYGIAAIISLLHDALLIISFASLANIEINSGLVAAILTVLGYSINDTIVIFDRVRENLNAQNNTYDFPSTINISLVETLGRTINTVITVLLVLVALILFGGSTTYEFCIVLFVGVIIGTYSSLFIASPILAILSRNKHSQTQN